MPEQKGLTEAEFDALENRYKTDDGFVKYTDFCKAIDTVFTIKGIEKNPNLRVKPVQSQDTLKAR